jgi:hypothetical protein
MYATENFIVMFPAYQIVLWVQNYLHSLFYRVLTTTCTIWTQILLEFLHRSYGFHYRKPTGCTISQIYLIKYSTCFGQVHCPSSGVSQHCIHAVGICHASSVGCLLAWSGWNNSISGYIEYLRQHKINQAIPTLTRRKIRRWFFSKSRTGGDVEVRLPS